MPIGLAAAIGIGSGLSALSGGAQMGMTAAMNKKNRQWQDSVRREQRGWALEDYQTQKNDALDFWHMENEYNSPDQQRRRLEAAGYNPALALGDVNSTGQAGQLETPNQPSNPMNSVTPMETPRVPDLGAGISQFTQALGQLEQVKGMSLDNFDKSKRNEYSSRVYENDYKNSNLMLKKQETGILLDNATTELTQQKIRYEAELTELTKLEQAQTQQETATSASMEKYYGSAATNLASQTALNEQSIDESQSRQGEISARIQHLQREISVIDKDLEWYDKMKRTNISQQIAQTRLTEQNTLNSRKQYKWIGRQDEPWYTTPSGDEPGWMEHMGYKRDTRKLKFNRSDSNSGSGFRPNPGASTWRP